MEQLDARRTALVLIDLQQGIATIETQPRTGEEVVATAKKLADRFRAAQAPVVLVHVGWRNGAERPSQKVDQPSIPENGTPPAFSELVDGLEQDGDIVVVKRQWGAFTGTDLDIQLRRRGIETIVLGGIATNMGVESTARDAWERGYHVVIVEDACASRTAEMHRFAIENILPRIARIRTAAEIAVT